MGDNAEKRPVSAKANPDVLTARQRRDESPEATIARYTFAPEVQAALTVREFMRLPGPETTLDALISELATQGKAGSAGDLAQGERMLVGQAHALDAIFGFCARRARGLVGEYPQTVDLYLRLALRAQAQCRATWETLATIKNPPPVAFVKQANIAAGPQQVNNGVPALARAGETGNAPSKLLGEGDGQRMDTGTPGTPKQVDSQLASVGTVDWSADRGGKEQGIAQCVQGRNQVTPS